MTNKYPKSLQTLIQYFKKLPGVGLKTAERLAFELLQWKNEEIELFSSFLSTVKKKLVKCPDCQALIDNNQCPFCQRRNSTQICILASSKDLYAMENTLSFQGIYFVLNHLISPLKGCHIDENEVEKIKKLVLEKEINEVIIALDSTLEGDATALFLKKNLNFLNVKISRLAFGLPVGSSFEYVDEGTLTRALIGRQNF